jgi:hypothetical protein
VIDYINDPGNKITRESPMNRQQMGEVLGLLDKHSFNVKMHIWVREQVKQGNVIWGRTFRGRGGWSAPE